jgi:hypothetical protein
MMMEKQLIAPVNIIVREPPWKEVALYIGHPYPGFTTEIRPCQAENIVLLRERVIGRIWQVIGIGIKGFEDKRGLKPEGHIGAEYLLLIRPGEVPIWWPKEFCEGVKEEE